MSFVLLLQVLTVAFLVIVFITQIFYPILRGSPLFPMLRQEGALLRKLSQMRQRRVERALKRRVEQEQSKKYER